MTIIYAVLIFCLLIFVHEFGHFAVAKMCGVKVNEFALGMGPAIFQKQRGETLYSLRIFPIGGFCAMEGEDEDSDEPRALGNQPAWQKACILAAGSFMNLLTCIVLMIIIAFWAGQATTTIDKVEIDSPAYKAGIQADDKIVAVNGAKTDTWQDVIADIGSATGETIDITVERDGKDVTLKSDLVYDEEAGRYRVGITARSKHNPAYAVPAGFRNTGDMAVLMYSTLKQLFTGKASLDDISGPVGVVYVTNEAAKSGLIYVIYIAAMLSLNLAIINMLPFPALDGGRLLFLVIRAIAGPKMSDMIEGKFHLVGILILFAFMIFITIKDVIKFVLPIF